MYTHFRSSRSGRGQGSPLQRPQRGPPPLPAAAGAYGLRRATARSGRGCDGARATAAGPFCSRGAGPGSGLAAPLWAAGQRRQGCRAWGFRDLPRPWASHRLRQCAHSPQAVPGEGGSRGRQHPRRSRALRAVSQTPRGVAPGPLRALTCSTVLAAVWWAPGRDLGAHPNVLEVVAGLRPELAQDGPMRPWAGAPHGGPSPAPLPCASLSPLWPLHVFPVDSFLFCALFCRRDGGGAEEGDGEGRGRGGRRKSV